MSVWVQRPTPVSLSGVRFGASSPSGPSSEPASQRLAVERAGERARRVALAAVRDGAHQIGAAIPFRRLRGDRA